MILLVKINPECQMDDEEIITELESLENAIDNKRAARRYKALGFKVTDH